MGRLRDERAESDGGSDAATSVRIVNEDQPNVAHWVGWLLRPNG